MHAYTFDAAGTLYVMCCACTGVSIYEQIKRHCATCATSHALHIALALARSLRYTYFICCMYAHVFFSIHVLIFYLLLAFAR